MSRHPFEPDAPPGPPHSLMAEENVIGSVLIAGDCWDAVAEHVSPADFYRAPHRLIVQAMAALSERRDALDVVTVAEALERRGELEDAGGLAYLAMLARNQGSAVNAAAYARVVRDTAVRRALMAEGHQMASDATGEADCLTILDGVQTRLSRLAEHGTQAGAVAVADLLPAMVADLESRMDRGNALRGLATGLQDLDKALDGLCPGRFYIVAGRPGMGKSLLALQAAIRAALDDEPRPVLFLSLEMPAIEVTQRAVSHVGRVDLAKLSAADLDEDQWAALTLGSARLKSAPLLIDDTSALTVAQIRARARRVQREHGLGLLVVDYLQLGTGAGENRNLEIGSISRGLKALAKELAIPVMAVSSLNRKLEERADKRPQMADLRESGDIESDADVILCLYRDEVYNPNTADKGLAELLIRKNRGGPLGMVPLRFDGALCRFDCISGGLPSAAGAKSSRAKGRRADPDDGDW